MINHKVGDLAGVPQAKRSGSTAAPMAASAAQPRRQERPERKVAEVWVSNLEEEMDTLREAIGGFQHVAVEVLLPKAVAAPTGPFGDYSDYNYQMLRCNVDLTRALQIVFTLSDTKGNRPKSVATWRFNLEFNPQRDFFLQEALEGVDLQKHSAQGIPALELGELLMTSGLVLMEDVKWIAFCGAAGLSEGPPPSGPGTPVDPPERRFCGMYSFGYLLQLLTCQEMPDTVEGFVELLDLYFPCRCDLAEYLHQLPQLSGRDPADTKQQMFCSAHHIMDGFFRLPEAARRTAFDREADEADGDSLRSAGAGPRRRPHRRRRDQVAIQ